MPAFYRMPVFYLALLLLGAGYGLVAIGRADRRGVVQTEPATPSAGRPAETAAEVPGPSGDAPAPIAEPDDGILRTAEGLRRKVLIREIRVVPRDRPMDGSKAGEELGLYSLWYLHGERPGSLDVGRPDGPRGWIPAEAALEWNSRLMARPVADGLVMYGARSCALDNLAGRSCTLHGDSGECPVVGLPGGSAGHATPMGLPILRSESIPQPEGPPRTIFEVAALVRDFAPSTPVRIADSDREALRDVHIAFVLDTTGSMTRYIDGAKAFARSLADEAARRYGDLRLRLGLVEYRDDRNPTRPEGFEFDRRVTIPFVEPRAFVEALDRVRATDYPDRSVSEKVFAGLEEAIEGGNRPFIGRPQLLWPTGRSGDLATKLIILIGDAPDHEDGPSAAETLARAARDARITVATIRIDDPKGQTLVADERRTYDAQWTALAEGSYRPADPDAGFAAPAPPLTFDLDDAGGLVSALRRLLDDRARRARELAELARAAAEGQLDEYRNRQGLTMDRLAPILQDLTGRAIPAEELTRAGTTVRAPTVRKGWVAERDAGRRLVEVEMLMTRDELETLIADLIRFGQALRAGATSRKDLLRLLEASAGGDRGFLDRDRGDETFADYLLRRGLPPPRSDSLLRRTQGDLASADRLLRQELGLAIAAAVAALDRRRREPDWGTGPLVDGTMSWVPYAPIDF